MGYNIARDPMGRKVITDIGDLSGTQRLIPPQNIGLINAPYFPPPNTLDLVAKSTTQSDTIHYARIGTVTNAAVVVPETQTSAPDATPTTAEGFKPESDLTFTPASATVYTIAHWVAATKQALSDFGQLRTLIDNFLVNGLRDKADGYVLSGTGTNEPAGILTAAAAFTTAYATSAVVSIRKGLTALALLGVTPNAVVMNPADTEALDLAQNANGVYYFGGGPGSAPSGYPIWGLRRVDDVKMTAGFALVGDFSMAVWYDREQATVTASDSHQDFFTRNLVAILGEMRGAFAVLRPNAFNIVDIAP
jgi:HK97 family phage major capsid protein